MKVTTAYAVAWIATCAAVSIGIVVSGSLVPLWALLIPGMISFGSEKA